MPRPICLCAGQANSHSAGAVWPGREELAAPALALWAPTEGAVLAPFALAPPLAVVGQARSGFQGHA